MIPMHLTDIATLGPRLRRLGYQRVVAGAVSATVLGLILWKIHPGRLLPVLAQAALLPVLAALLCVLSAALLLAVRWRWMLRLQEVDNGFRAAWCGVLVGNALSAALLGAVLADVAKSAWYSRRHRHRYDTVLLACGLDRVSGGGGLVVYATATLVAVMLSQTAWPEWKWSSPSPWSAVLIPCAVVAGSGLLWLGLRDRWRQQGHAFRQRIGAAWTALRTRPAILSGSIALSFVANLLIGATLAFALAAVSSETLPWAALLWTFPAIGLAASLPFTFAGAGAREGAALAIWALFGISAPVAVAAALITLAVTLLGAVPGAFLFLLSNGGREELRR